MSIPDPKPGLVIRYSFLWSHGQAAGAVEGSKDRPCAVVVASRLEGTGEMRTIIAPITHAAPGDATASIEIPAHICKGLGLDSGRHWLRCDELNRFSWPGFDLRQRPGRPGVFHYGMLPAPLFEELRKAILRRQKSGNLKALPRD